MYGLPAIAVSLDETSIAVAEDRIAQQWPTSISGHESLHNNSGLGRLRQSVAGW